jgi:hypothetical protein
MGTRADFYSSDMTWLGSIAWDGYPPGIALDVLRSTSDAVYRANVERFLAERDDSTLPERGWPWPWDDSGTTDYAYALRDGAVHASYFGSPWFRIDPEAEDYGVPDDEGGEPAGPPPEFPDMTATKNVRLDKGSGVIVLDLGGGQ